MFYIGLPCRQLSDFRRRHRDGPTAGPTAPTGATIALPTRNAFEVRHFSPESQQESAFKNLTFPLNESLVAPCSHCQGG